MPLLRLYFGGREAADAAQATLTERDITCTRTAEDLIEVSPDGSVTTVLRPLIEDGCEVLRVESGSAFEKAYYAAVADGEAQNG